MSRVPKVVSAAPRIAARAQREKQDRRTRWVRRTGWGVAALLPLLLAGWVVLSSSLLAVENVVISGQARLTEQQVAAAVAVDRGTPLARVDTGAIASRVKALGPVASVSVTRAWPDTLQVEVVERSVAAGVAVAGSWTLLAPDGSVVATDAVLPKGTVVLRAAAPGSPAAAAALKVMAALPPTVRTQLVSVYAPTQEQVDLTLRDGRRVLWGGATEGVAKGRALVVLLKMKGRVFDVSSPGVVTRR